MLSLDDRDVKEGLHLLLYTAAETLFDGIYQLDGRTRRSPTVMRAGDVLFDLSLALGKGLLDDTAGLQQRLTDVSTALHQLERALDISVITLMVRRDYATKQQRQRSAALRKHDRKMPRALLTLVTDNEQV